MTSTPYAVDLTKHGLTRRDRAILDLERTWWKYPGAKVTAIREHIGCTEVRYYQLVGALIDRPEALAADPLLVKRLRRLRDERRDQRAARRRHPSYAGGS